MNSNINRGNLISELKSYFNKKHYISTVYLFGSIVKGKNRKDSDIDLAVLFSEDMTSLQRFDYKLGIANELEDLLEMKVDIVDLESADSYFIHQILLNKMLLVEKDLHRRVEFEVKSRREYFDMLPFYKLYHSQALERLERR